MKNVLKPIPDFTTPNVQTSLTVVKLITLVLPEQKSALKISADNNQTEITNPPFYDELHFANYE